MPLQKDARAPILRREAEKHKRYDSRLAHIGPGIKLLAFGMNHIGALGSDAKEVIKEQAAILARKARTLTILRNAFYAPIYPYLSILSMPFLSMLENAVLIP